MAKTLEQVVSEQIGGMAMELAKADVRMAALADENAALTKRVKELEAKYEPKKEKKDK